MQRLLAVLASVMTIGVGLFTVYDLTLGTGVVAASFLRLTVVTLAILIVAGILNLLIVHFGRIRTLQRGWIYSIVLLVCTAATLVLWVTGQEDTNRLLLASVQTAIEASLAALTLFALVYGAYRLLHRRLSWANALFITAVIVVLAGALPFAETDLLREAREWLLAIPVSAGARGILLGIALGTVVTGVRVLIGQDRSYRE